mmetsp:Transcript_86782/g.265648  ORF Transcript_86782/g.265648 Transcript_86782/m.265648 type:complete len:264 (+) Transcript_86782:906-1697(+)
MPVDDREEDAGKHTVHQNEVQEEEGADEGIGRHQRREVKVAQGVAEAIDNAVENRGTLLHLGAVNYVHQHNEPDHRDRQHDHEPEQVVRSAGHGQEELREALVQAHELQGTDADHQYVGSGQPVVQCPQRSHASAKVQERGVRFLLHCLERAVFAYPQYEDDHRPQGHTDRPNLQHVENVGLKESDHRLPRAAAMAFIGEFEIFEVLVQKVDENTCEHQVHHAGYEAEGQRQEIIEPHVQTEDLRGLAAQTGHDDPACQDLEG